MNFTKAASRLFSNIAVSRATYAVLACAIVACGSEAGTSSALSGTDDSAQVGAGHDTSSEDIDATTAHDAVSSDSNADEAALRASRLEAYCGATWPSVEERVAALIEQMTLAEKVSQMSGTTLFAADSLYPVAGVPRLGIPGLVMVDGPRGVSKGTGAATAFPVGAARGATFDPALERRVGEAMARETRAKGASVLLAPTINLLRHPRWGRAQETYGEDPILLGEMGTAFVHGVQSERVLASAKHYAVNSIDDTRFDVDVSVGQRALREVYLPHFRQIVEEGAVASVMTAYNLVNGLYCSENPALVRDILKGEWGFQGFVESDWILGTRSTEAAALAGLDIEMPFGTWFGSQLIEAVKEGRVPESIIDEAVTRVLRAQLCYKLDVDPPQVDPQAVETAQHRALAREVAARSMVLLKNDQGALPLATGNLERIAVVGPLADLENIGDLGSSAVAPSEVITMLEGLVEALGEERVVHIAGFPFDASAEAELLSADAVVAVVGLTAEDEGEGFIASGDRKSLALPGAQAELLLAASNLNTRTVVVLQGGGAMDVRPWHHSAAAILMAWYPGMEGGRALADVLLGQANPSGRLPHAWPVTESDLPPFDNVSLEVEYDAWHGYRYLQKNGVPPQYPFGYGLSYTQFSYGQIELVSRTASSIDIDVELTNTGERDGIEVVQVYASRPNSAIERARRDLVAFEAVSLSAGETRQLRLSVRPQRLEHWDEAESRWRTEPGPLTLEVGPHSALLPLRVDIMLDWSN